MKYPMVEKILAANDFGIGKQNADSWVQEANKKAAEMLSDGKIDQAKHDAIVKENNKNYDERIKKLKDK